jgi:hypothetical protein
MRKKMLIYLAFAALLGAAWALASCVAPGPTVKQRHQVKSGPPPSLGIYYIGTSGKVGHHMYAEPRGRCSVTWYKNNFTRVSGSLPPGLRFRGSRIEGIPEIPGKWQVTVRFTGVKCQGRAYADQNVHVYFNINGIAPRRLR